jgi:ABC-2 type transport system ATP-binding protein
VPPTLEVAGLVVAYRERQVLDGLSLTVPAGEIFGLLGSNGAGKTTLIRTICGRVTPRSGEVKIAGVSNRDRRALRRIGIVPQELGLYHHLTVRENLEVFARLSGVRGRAARAAVERTIAATQLAPRLKDRVEILSGGWKRRVNIAAAILHDPALLILDEPTVGVDIDARNELHEVIRGLSREGMAVLLATHDMEQAETLCATVGFLRQGRLEPIGSPTRLVETRFAGQRKITVELRGALSTGQREALLTGGFAPESGDAIWSAFGRYDDDAVTRLTTALNQLSIDAREIRHRKPGLDTLFAELARKAPAASETA